MQPELHRPLPVERVGPNGLDVTVEATPAECAALAERMNLPAIQRLVCTFHLSQLGLRRVLATGHLQAEVTQTCVVTSGGFRRDPGRGFPDPLRPGGRDRRGTRA